MKSTHIVHGISFVRTGKCNRCGACNCEKFNCPHFSWDAEHKTVCSIHDKLTKVCKVCTEDEKGTFYDDGKPVTHQMCADFPSHPWLNVIKEGKCGYKFTEIKIGGISKKDILDAKWVK